MTALFPGLRRVGLTEFFGGDVPPWTDVWLDQVLYDIPQTVLSAVRSAASSGARAVTLYAPLIRVRSYAVVLEACAELGLGIAVAQEPTFERSVYRRSPDV